jgi:hypothetical protein
MGEYLTWTPSQEAVEGYHVYRAPVPEGPYERLTTVPIESTSYTDPEAPKGDWVYMVRALKLQTSAGGSYYNLSQGTFSQIVTAVGEPSASVDSWALYK